MSAAAALLSPTVPPRRVNAEPRGKLRVVRAALAERAARIETAALALKLDHHIIAEFSRTDRNGRRLRPKLGIKLQQRFTEAQLIAACLDGTDPLMVWRYLAPVDGAFSNPETPADEQSVIWVRHLTVCGLGAYGGDWATHFTQHCMVRLLSRSAAGLDAESALLQAHDNLLKARAKCVESEELLIPAAGGAFLGRLIWVTAPDGTGGPEARCTTFLSGDQLGDDQRPITSDGNGVQLGEKWFLPGPLRRFDENRECTVTGPAMPDGWLD